MAGNILWNFFLYLFSFFVLAEIWAFCPPWHYCLVCIFSFFFNSICKSFLGDGEGKTFCHLVFFYVSEHFSTWKEIVIKFEQFRQMLLFVLTIILIKKIIWGWYMLQISRLSIFSDRPQHNWPTVTMTAEPAEQSRKRPRLEQQTGGPEAVPDEIWLGILRERSETNLLFFNKLVPYIESNYIVFALGYLHRSIFSIRNDIPPHTFFGNLMFLPISMFDATRSPFYTYMYVSVPVPYKTSSWQMFFCGF